MRKSRPLPLSITNLFSVIVHYLVTKTIAPVQRTQDRVIGWNARGIVNCSNKSNEYYILKLD